MLTEKDLRRIGKAVTSVAGGDQDRVDLTSEVGKKISVYRVGNVTRMDIK